jgi:hypothetical protein
VSDQTPNPSASTPVNPAGECSFCREHLGAYALQALDRVDQGLVEQHLRWCAECRAELARHEDILTGLGLQGDDVGEPLSTTWTAIRARIADEEDESQVRPRSAITTGEHRSPGAGRSNRWLPISAIAPLALVIILLSAWSWSLQRDLTETQAELSNHTLLNSTLATSQQVQLYSMEQTCPTCDGVGQIGVSESSGMGMVVGWDFDPQVTHDVWGIDHQGERSRMCSLMIAQDGAVMQMFAFPDSPSNFTDLVITDQSGNPVYQSHIMAGDKVTTPTASPPS